MRIVAAVLLLLLPAVARAQAPADPPPVAVYPFLVLDSPPTFTMRQVNQDFLSAWRLYAGSLNTHLKPAVSFLLQGASSVLLLKTLTHEEGHRAVLRSEGIGSETRSFLFMPRAGYVDHVTDASLQHLRDTNLPAFVHVHTAGSESDYALATREETLMAFGQENYRNLAVDYLLRKSSLLIYFTEGIFHRNTDGAEEADELDRDIVGNDLYGAIRHLYRPGMAFHRYTRLEDLTGEERRYLERIQWRTFFNLANLNVVGIPSFRLNDRWRANVGMAHCMGPFGDFIDERVWLTNTSGLKTTGYVRQFENRDRWFIGAGAGVMDYRLTPRLETSATLHYWQQPAGLSFTNPTAKSGGAIDLEAHYQLATRNARLSSVAMDVGMIYKTVGFLPEEIVLEDHFGLRFGLRLGIRSR
jgi:hypothetical protein